MNEGVGTARFRSDPAARLAPYLAQLVALALVYFAAGKLGLKLALFHQSASPVWPPTGIAMAAVLLLGRRVWPGIWVGAFLVNATAAGSVLTSVGIATGNTLEAVIGAALATRFANGRHAFDDPRDVLRFTLLAAMLSTMVSPTLGVTSLTVGGYAFWADFPLIWLTWWLGDLVGAVTITPLIVVWSTMPLPRWDRRRTIEALLMSALVAVTGVIVFTGLLPDPLHNYMRPFMAIPPLLWAAYRFGQRGAITAVLLLSGIALWGALHGVGPFVLGRPNESLLVLQAFVWTITVTNLVLGAAVSEGQRVENALRQSRGDLQGRLLEIENLYQTAPVGLCLLDARMRHIRINERLAAIHGLPVAAHSGRTLRELLPGLADILEPLHLRVLSTGLPCLDHEFSTTAPAEPGVERHWLASYYPVRAANGDLLGLSGVIVDITERKRTEAELQAWRHELEARVQARTIDLAHTQQALRDEVSERKKLEALMARIVEREQLRLGSELHDGLGQRLTGISLLLAELQEKLQGLSPDCALDARRLQDLVEQSIQETQSLARGFYPVEMEGFGLLTSLKNLARRTSRSFGVTCLAHSDVPRHAEPRGPAAVQLYRIVQEALHNAVKHSGAKHIDIRLISVDGDITLTIADDGVGLPPDKEPGHGMGLRIMRYRAQTIGGTLDVRNSPRGGVIVACAVPATEWSALLAAEDRDT